jgi:hypothetical protein
MHALKDSNRHTSEERAMPPNEDKDRAEPLAGLRSDVKHLQSDVTELRVEARGVTQRVDALRVELTDRIEKVDGKIDVLRVELGGKIDAVRGDLIGRTDNVRSELTDRIDAFREHLSARIDAVSDSLASAKIWALTLYIALAGSLFFALARGFKWI